MSVEQPRFPDTVEIRVSGLRTGIQFVLDLVMFSMSALLFVKADGVYAQVAGVVGLVLFGSGAVIFGPLMIQRPVWLTMSPAGVRYRKTEVAWNQIHTISTLALRYISYVVLHTTSSPSTVTIQSGLFMSRKRLAELLTSYHESWKAVHYT